MKPRNRRPNPYAPRLTRVLVTLMVWVWLAGVMAIFAEWMK